MTGPDHYRLAEELLIDARRAQEENDAARARRLAIAQVHATVALAAATAIGEDRGWNDVAGPRLAANGPSSTERSLAIASGKAGR